MDPGAGVCNGTCAILINGTSRVLQARILTGDNAGDTVLIPRITLRPTDLELPFILERRQFSVRLAFSMSINKAQGQSVSQVGLNLQRSVFSHGQLYVALSQSTTKRGVKILFPEGMKLSLSNSFEQCTDGLLISDQEDCTSKNIVYPEVLLDPPTH